MSSKSPYVTLAGATGVFVALIAVNVANDDSAPAPASTSPTVVTATDGASASVAPPTDTSSPPPSAEPPATATKTTQAPAFPRKAVYAGHTADGGPALAVAIAGDQAAAYFCDGVSAESWMTGWARNGKFSLTGKDNAKITGRLHNGAVKGSTRVQGKTYDFRLRPVSAPAGLYRAKGDSGTTTIGWIVLPDGSQVGIENDNGSAGPAPALTPGDDVRVDGRPVVPHQVQGDEEL